MKIDLTDQNLAFLTELTGLEIAKIKNPKTINSLLEQGQINAQNYLKRQKLGQKFSLFEENNLFNVLVEIKKILKLAKIPRKIECYDISHLSGTAVYGSMVVFIDGTSTKSLYRIFKCPEINDDFANHAHILTRRLNKFWEMEMQVETLQKALLDLENAEILETEIKQNDNKIELTDKIISENSSKNPEVEKTMETSWENIKKTEQKSEENWQKFQKNQTENQIKKSDNNSKNSSFENNLTPKNNLIYPIFKALLDYNLAEKIKLRNQIQKKLLVAKKNLKDWSFPDLIIVDGGKGQLAADFQVLQNLNLSPKIEIVALAKKEEEIFTLEHILNQNQLESLKKVSNNSQNKNLQKPFNSNFNPSLDLDKNSNLQNSRTVSLGLQDGILLSGPAKFLVQRIRDEAHRFAIKHNRKALVAAISESSLDKVVGPKTKIKLLSKFGSLTQIIQNLTENEELIEETVGFQNLNKLKKHFLG